MSCEVDYKRCVNSNECAELLPILVYLNITVNTLAPLLLHLMLILRKSETELDLQIQGIVRESLAKTKLIGEDL